MNEKEIKKKVSIIIKQADFVNLGTIDEEGFPNIRLMMNLKNWSILTNH